jgi:hypothetical protein
MTMKRLLTSNILMQADFIRFLYKMGLMSFASADKVMDRLTVRMLEIDLGDDNGPANNKKK